MEGKKKKKNNNSEKKTIRSRGRTEDLYALYWRQPTDAPIRVNPAFAHIKLTPPTVDQCRT